MATLIGYARVSKQDQSLDLQIDALEQAGCQAVYSDKISGKTTLKDRKGLSRALARAKRGDTLVIWKLDRLGRTVSELIRLLALLQRRGIHMRELSAGMGLDTASPTGKLLFHVFAAFAELERSLAVERTIAGLEAARRRGSILGRPRAMVAGRARKARKMLSEGRPVHEIADAIGVHASTVYRWRKDQRQSA